MIAVWHSNFGGRKRSESLNDTCSQSTDQQGLGARRSSAGLRRGISASTRGRGQSPVRFPAIRLEYILAVGYGLDGSQLNTVHPQVVTSSDKATRRRGQEGHCSGVNAKSDGVRPAVSCIGSKQGSLSLPHCAPAGGRWQPGRHGVLSQGARARSAALCRACSECSSMAIGKHSHSQTWRGGRGRNWRRDDI